VHRGKPATTLYVVAYDIPSDRRRTKLHRLLCGYGEWTQYSLFECFLDEKQLLALQAKIETLLDADQDSVRFYHVCAACLKKAETVGSPKPQEKTVFIV
jgi:CRISPR-associated protein Cas2